MGRVKDISNTRVNKLYVTDKKEIRFSSNSKNKKIEFLVKEALIGYAGVIVERNYGLGRMC